MHFNLFDSQGEGTKKEDHKKTRYSRTSCRTQIFFFFPDDTNNVFFQIVVAGYTS